MILFVILALIVVILMVAGIIVLSVGGASFVIIFSDVIVCAIFITWIIKRLIKQKKK